jgi:hypothetical protein
MSLPNGENSVDHSGLPTSETRAERASTQASIVPFSNGHGQIRC